MLLHNADPTLVGHDGKSAFDHARGRQFTEIANILSDAVESKKNFENGKFGENMPLPFKKITTTTAQKIPDTTFHVDRPWISYTVNNVKFFEPKYDFLPSGFPLHDAIAAKDEQRAMELIGQMQLGEIDLLNHKDYTALTIASIKNLKPIVEVLLFKNADPNARSSKFKPLYAASSGGHTEIFKLLVDNGADVNLASVEGKFNASFD